MSYLLDTNVICELVRPKPMKKVVKWVDAINDTLLYISVITLGEIRKGVDGIQDAQRREKITQWLEADLPAYFDGRILNIDKAVADRWGRVQFSAKNKPLAAIDGLIAATALTHHLTLVTRNVKDFSRAGVEIINPWEL